MCCRCRRARGWIYKRLFDKFSNVSSQDELSARFFSSKRFVASTDELRLVPGAPLGYWVGNSLRDCFKRFGPVLDVFDAKHGMSTSDNGYFVRWWFEISIKSIGFGFLSRNDAAASDIKWFPYNKGGEFRRWYGNGGHLVNWQYDGKEIKEISDSKYPYLNGNLDFVIGGQKYFFQPGVRLISYAIGCMMGRYSLDEPGLIYANAPATLASMPPAINDFPRRRRRHRADHRRTLVRGRRHQPGS
jgi:hypothetical protein